jgi:hypothetical protein
MLNIAVILFAIAAVGGLLLASAHFRGKEKSMPLALLHGLLAASGLVLLLIPVIRGSAPGSVKAPLILFLAAALGGFLLFAFHLQKKKLPSAVVVLHGGLAVVAFALLVFGLYFRH